MDTKGNKKASKGNKKQTENFLFWILQSKKYLSFPPLSGYEVVKSDTKEEMWEKIFSYIDARYKAN